MSDRDDQSDKCDSMMDFSDDMKGMAGVSPEYLTTGVSLDGSAPGTIIVPVSPLDNAEIAQQLNERRSCDSLGYSVHEPSRRSASSSHVPMQKVGSNYRHLQRRRGAAIHSQLLKAAFEASMSANLSDDDDNGDEGTDDYSMYASSSTLASRDGIEDIVITPRKRVRNDDCMERRQGISSPPMVSGSPILHAGDLFDKMALKPSTPLVSQSPISDSSRHCTDLGYDHEQSHN